MLKKEYYLIKKNKNIKLNLFKRKKSKLLGKEIFIRIKKWRNKNYLKIKRWYLKWVDNFETEELYTCFKLSVFYRILFSKDWAGFRFFLYFYLTINFITYILFLNL